VWYISQHSGRIAAADARGISASSIITMSVTKYNETLTLFWIKLVCQYLDELDPKCSVLDMRELPNQIAGKFTSGL
jgi:hypothetical protein